MPQYKPQKHLRRLKSQKYLFWQQWEKKLEIGNRGKTGKMYTYVELNQHVLKQPMDQRRNQKRNHQTPWDE